VRRVAISASSTIAAGAAAEVADAGGNAVDAAVAAIITGMISEPGIIGPGASGFVTVWPADSDPCVIDGYTVMPGLSTGQIPEDFGKKVFIEYGGGMETMVGPQSVSVAGIWAALGDAVERFGSAPWAAVMAPAIDIARRGFPLSPVSESYLAYTHEPIYDADPEGFAALHHEDGTRVADGDTIRIPALADALETIGSEGPASCYTGTIGRRLAEAMERSGGSVTLADLEAYASVERVPTRVEFDGWEIATNPPPAIGGAVLGAMLLLLDDSGYQGHTPEGIRLLTEIQRSVLSYRAKHLDGASHSEAAAARLLELATLGDRRALLESPSTIHASTVDTDGAGCAITTSAGYGSGVVIPGTGMWMNNSLGEIELFSRGRSVFAPGERLPSNMAPTVARGPRGEVLSLGTPGASRITTSLTQVLANLILLGMSVSEAVEHSRLHVEVFDGEPTIAHEPGLPVRAFDDFKVRRFPDHSMYFGGVGLVMYDPVAGLFEAADQRRTGATAVGGL
jgi:gamma-glutamyltranspeptidase/glutathione hydrolase